MVYLIVEIINPRSLKMKKGDKITIKGVFNGTGTVGSLYYAHNVKTGKKERMAQITLGNITFHKPVKDIK